LRDNPLNDISVNTYIPQLQARGVTVFYDKERPEVEEESPWLWVGVGIGAAILLVAGIVLWRRWAR